MVEAMTQPIIKRFVHQLMKNLRQTVNDANNSHAQYAYALHEIFGFEKVADTKDTKD